MFTPFCREPLDPRLVLARLVMGSILPATDGAQKLRRQDELFSGVISLFGRHVLILQKRPGELRRACRKTMLRNQKLMRAVIWKRRGARKEFACGALIAHSARLNVAFGVSNG